MVVLLIVVGGGSFYGGMKYGQGKKTNLSGSAKQGFQNMTDEQRQQRAQNGGLGRMGNGNGGLANGEIISKDDKSVTIKLRDGGSKIILFSDSTKVTKNAEGTKNDLKVGENLMVSGDSNSDGSVTAKTIQLMPAVLDNAPKTN